MGGIPGTLHLTEVSAQVSFTSTGDKLVFTPGRPINVIRWGLVADALIDVGAGMIVACDFRPTAGSDASRTNGSVSSGVDTAGGTISTSTTDVAAGAGLFHDVVAAGYFQVNPGEQIVIEVTDAADTAGTGYVFIEYIPQPFQGEASSGLDNIANRIFNMTQKAS